MSRFVLDCSVAMAWCFEDESDAYSDAVLDRLAQETAVVPCLWPLEVANVLVVAERRGRLTEADSARFLQLLLTLPIAMDERTVPAAGALLALARAEGLSAYDAAYLDLAMREDAALATGDAALAAAARRSGVRVLA